MRLWSQQERMQNAPKWYCVNATSPANEKGVRREMERTETAAGAATNPQRTRGPNVQVVGLRPKTKKLSRTTDVSHIHETYL